MAVTVRGTTKGGTSSAVSSISVSTHASTASGDQILVGFAVKGAINTGVIPPADGTWTQVASKSYPNLGILRIFAKTATAGGVQSFTFTLVDAAGASTTVVPEWICHVVTGQGSVESLSSGLNGTTSPVTTAGITTTEASEYLVRFVGGYVNAGTTDQKTSTWDSPATLLANAQGTNGTGTGLSWISASDETGPGTAGAVAGRVLTLESAALGWASLTIGVKVPTVTPPTNTAPPSIAGTAAVGSTLTLTPGTWDQTVTLTYQWQRDGVDIAGNTAGTYTLVSGDAGHTIRVVETATNGASATATANSNGIAVPSAPVNTAAPSISGPNTPALTGDTLTVTPGTWTGTGITLTYQWYRGTSPISGQTATTYTLVTSDEGANITVREIATNGGAPSGVTADSNVITPSVTAPISDASFLTYLSGGTGNTDPSLSYGGARGGTMPVALNALFGPILGTVAQAGGTFYRVIYVRNTHTTATAAGCKLFLEQQYDPTSGMTLSVAVPSQGVNTSVPALASGTTAPSGVTWTSATTSGGGRTFGDLGPGAYRGVYVRLVIAAGAPQTSEVDAVIAVEGSAA